MVTLVSKAFKTHASLGVEPDETPATTTLVPLSALIVVVPFLAKVDNCWPLNVYQTANPSLEETKPSWSEETIVIVVRSGTIDPVVNWYALLDSVAPSKDSVCI